MNALNRISVVQPGEMSRDGLKTLGPPASTLPSTQDVPVNRITTNLHAQRGVTANTALGLTCQFGTTARIWPQLRTACDLRRPSAPSHGNQRLVRNEAVLDPPFPT